MYIFPVFVEAISSPCSNEFHAPSGFDRHDIHTGPTPPVIGVANVDFNSPVSLSSTVFKNRCHKENERRNGMEKIDTWVAGLRRDINVCYNL